MTTYAPVHTSVAHILLVDDEDDCNFVTKLVLKKAGYQGRLTTFTSACNPDISSEPSAEPITIAAEQALQKLKQG